MAPPQFSATIFQYGSLLSTNLARLDDLLYELLSFLHSYKQVKIHLYLLSEKQLMAKP